MNPDIIDVEEMDNISINGPIPSSKDADISNLQYKELKYINSSDYDIKPVRPDTSFKISKQELISHGCRNCIWKLHNMCPSGYTTPKEFKDTGICDEFVTFLYSLVHEGDSVNVLWENYNLYVLRLQSLEDYKEFVQAQQELVVLESTGANEDKITDMASKRNSYKLWWMKLNDTVLRSLGKIVDREKKIQPDTKPRMTVQQLNIIIDESAKKLVEYEKGVQ
jgi:hypothetical protein